MTLKIVCAQATRRACTFVPELAISAVAHVPMLAPKISGNADSKFSSP